MTTFPNSPKLLKGGIVLIDPETSAVGRIIALQYNPDTLSRTLQVQAIGTGSGGRSEPLRINHKFTHEELSRSRRILVFLCQTQGTATTTRRRTDSTVS